MKQTATEIIQKARQAAFTHVKDHAHLEPELGDSLRVWLVVDMSTKGSKVAKILENNGFVDNGQGQLTMMNPSGLWYGTESLRAEAAELAAEILRREMRLQITVMRESINAKHDTTTDTTAGNTDGSPSAG